MKAGLRNLVTLVKQLWHERPPVRILEFKRVVMIANVTSDGSTLGLWPDDFSVELLIGLFSLRVFVTDLGTTDLDGYAVTEI